MATSDFRVCWSCGAAARPEITVCSSCGIRHGGGRYLPTQSEFQRAGVERFRGRVKWWNDEKGFGFLTSDEGTDIFVHHSRIVADGYRSLREGERVEFEVSRATKGLRADAVTYPGERRPEEPEGDLPIEEHVMLLDADGSFRCLPCVRGPAGNLVIDSSELRSLFADSSLPISSAKAHHWKICAEFERLLNDPSVPEAALQEFFEAYPEFLLGDQYEAAYPQVVLESESGRDARPDFILRPFAGVTYEPAIVELKLPRQPIVKLTGDHVSLYDPVSRAVAQLRTYARAFEEAHQRDRLAELLGCTVHRPTLALVVGRSAALPGQRALALAREGVQPVRMETYDDLLHRYRRRSGLA